MVEVKLEEQMSRLAQIVAEDTYSKSNVQKNVKAHIEKYMDFALPKLATTLIEKYLADVHYTSKNARLDHIRHLPAEELMLEVISVMCPIIEPVTIQGPAARIGNHLEYDDVFDGVKTAAELITLCAMAGLIRIHAAGIKKESLAIACVIPPDQELFNWLEKVRYPNPMVCHPDKWVGNSGGGYLTTNDSILLGKLNNHEDYQAKDALNILQNIAWTLDQDVLKEEELPKKIPETQEQAIAFLQMLDVSKEVYSEIGENPFWFEWQFDFRGRAYSHGYHINLQSSEYKKAMLNLAKKEKIR